MLGLAILFGLAVWVIITILAMIIGAWLGKKTNHSKEGALIGFMLTMGGWFIYWALEFAYIQASVAYLCHKEAGITVYVTPEEWRKQIGEAEWRTLYEFDYSRKQYYPTERFIYEQKEYVPTSSYNDRLIRCRVISDKEISEFIGKAEVVIFDIKYHKPILRYIYFSAGAGPWLAGGSPKFWLNNINDCSKKIHDEFDKLIHLYSNQTLKLGETYESSKSK